MPHRASFCSALFAAMVLTPASVSAQDAREAGQLAIVETYFEHLNRVFSTESSETAIDGLLALTTPDVRYVHTIHSADFDRETWRAGMMRQLEAGSYNSSPDSCTHISNHIPGNGYIAVEYSYGELEDGVCETGSAQKNLAIFQLRDGLIARVEELW